MDRNKIIAVAALAIGIVALRTGAMEQEQSSISKIRAMLFGTTENVPEMELERIQSKQTKAEKAVEKDVPWMLSVRNEKRADETEQQAIERAAKKMPTVRFNEAGLEQLIVKLNAAVSLNYPALIERYKKEIADMLISDESMRRLASNDTTIIQRVKAGLPDDVLERCSHYISEGYWGEMFTHDHFAKKGSYSLDSASFSADGSKIVTTSNDGWIKIWNAATGDLIETWGRDIVTTSNGQAVILKITRFESASFSPDGKIVTVGSIGAYDKIVTIWHARGWQEHNLTRSAMIQSASFSPDGSKVVTISGYDRKVEIWNAATGVLEHTLEKEFKLASISVDGSKVVTASWYGGKVEIWNAATGALEHTLEKSGTSDFASVSFSSDGRKIVTASRDGMVEIWNAATGALEHTLKDNASRLDSASFSVDGSKIMTMYISKESPMIGDKLWTATIWMHLPVHTFEQALLIRVLQWAKEHRREPIWISGWGHSVMDSYSEDKKKLIERFFPKLPETWMQEVGKYFGFSSSSSSSSSSLQ